MERLPHERLVIQWSTDKKSFSLTLPWVSMEIDVDESEKDWITQATEKLFSDPGSTYVQRFLEQLKDYPIFYYKPRSVAEFRNQELELSPPLEIDYGTPGTLFDCLSIETLHPARSYVPEKWTWDWEKVLSKSRIEGTDLYDPVSLASYLICYRLEWENKTWSGMDGLGKMLEKFLKEDEDHFFRAIGWITRQSLHVTLESCRAMEPALSSYKHLATPLEHFIADEAGHYKFMEQVFEDIGLSKDEFTTGPGTEWLLKCHEKMARLSPFAFSAMINLFEAAFYEGEDPISRVINKSSKPFASRGYDLHYKINQEHRHCDVPLYLCKHISPQDRKHAEFTLAVFELALHLMDETEKNMEYYLAM